MAKGGDSIDVSFVTEWKLGPAAFRAWYHSMGTAAEYSGNYAPLFTVDGPSTYDARLVLADTGSVQVDIDDARALDIEPYDTVPDEGVSPLRAGIDWSSGQTERFEVFMDDLVLATTPVACSDP